MALIGCPECEAQVSDTALKCPSCGVALRKLKRGVFGQIMKWSFIGFNLLMLYAFFSGMGAASKVVDGTTSSAEAAGAAIGTGIGAMFILAIWFFGSVILGLFVLFTRPKA